MEVKRRGYQARPNQVSHLVPGLIAIGVGALIVVVLSRKADPAETAGIRLFGSYFMMVGLLFFSSGLQALRVPPLVVQIVATAALVALAYPFNTIWTSPLVAFQVGKWVLNGIVLLALVSTVMMIRRGPPVVAPSDADALADPYGGVVERQPRKPRPVGAAICAALAVLMLVLAWQLGGETFRRVRTARRADGVVVRQAISYVTENGTRRGGPMYSAVIRFDAGGRPIEITQKMASGSPMYAEGAAVPVLFHPDDPGSAVIDDPLDLYFMPGLLTAIGVALSIVAVVLGWPRRRRNPAGSAPDWSSGVERR